MKAQSFAWITSVLNSPGKLGRVESLCVVLRHLNNSGAREKDFPIGISAAYVSLYTYPLIKMDPTIEVVWYILKRTS